MQIRHVQLLVALTLIPDLQISPVVAAPQEDLAFSQPALESSGSNVRRSSANSSGYDSGLWRSEYLKPHHDEEIDAEGSSHKASGGVDSGDSRIGSLQYSDKLVLAPIDLPVAIGTAELQSMTGREELAVTTMSDWENAASKVTGSKAPGFTASGPSATSAIVGCVGILIVIGAYASSGRSRH